MTWAIPILVALAAGAPLAAQTRLQRPKLGPPTVIPAGPAWLAAGSDYPLHFVVKWTAVPNATSYRLWRSMGTAGVSKFQRTYELRYLDTTTEPGYVIFLDRYDLWLGHTYNFQVEATFVDANGNVTISLPSPISSAQSLSPMAPGNIRYTASPSATKGEVSLLLTWDPVAGAIYHFVGGTFKTPKGSTYIIPTEQTGLRAALFDTNIHAARVPDGWRHHYPLYPGNTYTFCLHTVYPTARDPSVQNCLTVPL